MNEEKPECFRCGVHDEALLGNGSWGNEYECDSCYSAISEFGYYDREDKAAQIEAYVEGRIANLKEEGRLEG